MVLTLSRLSGCLIPLVAFACLASPAAAKERTKLAVLDLDDKGVGAATTQSLTDVVTVALNELGVFDVLSRADIQQMLAFEQGKQMLGCESDTSCLAEIGGALGVALLVHGSIGKVGSTFMVNLALTSSSTAKVLAREQRQIALANELPTQVKAAARFLVRDLLQKELGYLVLQASESGADVEVDGRIVGVTPLARQNLSGGPHTLRVSKKGFVSFARDIDVVKDSASLVDAQLVPSLEFIADYDGRATTWRRLAYISGGLGLAGLAFGAGGWMWNGGRADDYEVRLAAAGCAAGSASSQSSAGKDCSAFVSERASLRRMDVIAQAAGFTSVALLGVAAYLVIEGPTPGLYDRYKPAEAMVERGATAMERVALGVAPTGRGGWVAALQGAF